MPQLCLHNCNRCAAVNQFAGYVMAKSMKSGQRYSQPGEQSAQLLLPQFIRRVRTASAIYEQQVEVVLTIVAR